MTSQAQPTGTPVSGPVPVLAQAFAALDDAGIDWALLRGADELADPQGDVDVLAGLPDLRRADEALAAVGWLRLAAPGRGSHRFWFGYDERADRWLKLDVVTRVEVGAWHELRLPLGPDLLARRWHDGSVWRLAGQDEQWLRLLHEVCDKGRPGLPWVEGLTTRGPVPAAFDAVVGAGAAERLLDQLAPPRRTPAAAAEAARARLARRLRSGRRWPLGRGRIVQVLGPDGAGKTTLAGALVEQLPVDAAPVYMGLWRQSATERRLAPLPGGTTATRVARMARKVLWVRWHAARGRLVVLDRSAYDALLADADHSAGGRVLAWLALRWSPEPFLVVLLDAPGQVLFGRKPEHPVEVLEQRRQDYLAQHPGALVLDASRSADEVRRAALAGVWTRLAQLS